MIVKEALKLIKRSLGEHGWFGREETDCIEQAIKQQETLQAEHEALKKDIARYFELAPAVAKRLYETQPDEEVNFDDLDALYAVENGVFPYTGIYKEYIELKDKLSKVGGE